MTVTKRYIGLHSCDPAPSRHGHKFRNGRDVTADVCVCVRKTSNMQSIGLTLCDSRDNGLPFSNWITRISPRFQTPVNAILFTAGYTTVMSLLNVRNTAALETLLSLSNVALMAVRVLMQEQRYQLIGPCPRKSYALSIGCLALQRVRGHPLPRACWSLGKAGLPVNCVGLFYTSWSFFWSLWPSEYHPTLSSFNWACVLFVGLVGIACCLHHFGARQKYHTPVVKMQYGKNEW